MGYIIIYVVPATFIILLFFIYRKTHENAIKEKISYLGGKVISIEQRNIFTGLGPFKNVIGKGYVYKILYEVGSITKEGWVKFGVFYKDWRL